MADGKVIIQIVPDDSQYMRTMRRLASETGKTINQGVNTHLQPLGKITGEANEFQKSLAASNARVVAFGASAGAIYAIKQAFQQLVRSTIEVEREMTEINAIFQLGSSQLHNFSNQLFVVANSYGTAFSEASKAAAEFARQGLTVEETLKRTSAALAISRISGTSLEQSVSTLTSVMNTFVKESLSAEDVINRLVAVDQAYAVSVGDLAEGLSRVSSSASDANVSLNQTIGLITAAKQITARSGSVIGNSFKTLFTRLQRPQVIDDLEAVGVRARDTQGNLKPMIEILRSLASTYDTLATSQKSFIAETVGGVYQINILKAIMRDLGSGMSIVDGAIEAAGHSAEFTNKRMAVLNETISSQLVRAGNDLKQAFSNIGQNLFSGAAKTGIGGFERLVKTVGKYTDSSTAKEGEGPEKLAANLVQGGIKGIGNIIKGPGLQIIALALLKLFANLNSFILQSSKDLLGVNQKEKERLSLNQGISVWLGKEKELLQSILSGHVSINTATTRYLEDMKDAVSLAKSLKEISSSMGSIASTQVKFIPQVGAASGYIPDLEVSEARRGGYQAGNVLNTTISNGFQNMDIVANSAESVTRVMQDGKAFDYVNPPQGSPAANLHRQESLRQTGIDPYELPHSQLKGRGFIPSLALSPELIQSIVSLGIDPQQIVKKGNATKMDDFTNLPEELVAPFVSRYRTQPESLSAALVSMVRKGNNIPVGNTQKLYDFFRGFMLNQSYKSRGLFPDVNSKEAVQVFAESLTGKKYQPVTDLAKQAQNQVRLRPQDIQKVFDLHAKSIPFIAAYESSDSLQPATDRPNLVTPFEFKTDKVSHQFQIPTPIYGHKSSFKRNYEKIREFFKGLTKNTDVIDKSDFGNMFGSFFDYEMRGEAHSEGIPVGSKGSPLDIYGPVKSILSETNIKHPVSALELKASAGGAKDSGNMGEKIFRTLAGEPGGKGNPSLKGPVGYVPKLANVRQFDAALGGIGIIDADKYGGDKANYESLIYAAVASGKPIRIHYGPMTTGKTTAAERIVELSGGLGGKGGNYIAGLDDIDSDSFKQFIINKTDQKHLNTGTFGLALSAASQVRAFYHPYSRHEENKDEMVRRLKERNRGQEGVNAEAIAHKYGESDWAEYGSNIEMLGKKLGDRVKLYNPEHPLAARGAIPNLVTRDWGGVDDDMRQNYNSSPQGWDSVGGGAFKGGARLDINKDTFVDWDEVNGVLNIEGIYRNKNETNPWGVLGKFIKKNAKRINQIDAGNIVGPKIPKVLQHFIQSPRISNDIKGTELKGYFSPSILVKEAVRQLKHKEGISPRDFKQMIQAMKFLGVKDFKTMKPFDIDRTLARGFVPYLSMDDSHKKIVSLSNDMKMYDAVARHSYTFIDKSAQLKNKIGKNTLNREFLAASLTNGALGRNVSDIPILEKTMGIDANFFDVILEGFKNDLNIPELKQRVKKGEYARGFIPSLSGAITQALARENRATGGHAVLDSDPSLRTQENPLGLAAIDSRNQSSAREAIKQHMGLGQSINEVRTAGAAQGFIPSLVTGYDSAQSVSSEGIFSSGGIVNSLLLAALGGLRPDANKYSQKSDESKVNPKGFLYRLTSEGERAAAKLRILTREFEAANETLRSGKKAETSFGSYRVGNGIEKLEKDVARIAAPLREIATPYQEQKERRTGQLTKIGVRTALSASMAGGIATQFAELSSPSFGASINEFSNGLTQAGQVLLTFPNKFGAILGLSFATSAFISAMDISAKGLQNSERAFDIANAKYQKLTSQIDALAVSLNQYDSMIMDASVSFEAIQREQRKYTETLAQLGQTDEGAKVAARVKGAPDTKGRIAVLLEEKDRGGRKQELQASALELQKYASQRSFLFGKSRTVLGINPLGFSNPTQRTDLEHLIRGTGGAAVQNLSGPLKEILYSADSVIDFNRKLALASEDTNSEIANSAKELIEVFSGLAKIAGTEGVNIVHEQIRSQLQTEKNDSTPQALAAQKGLRDRTAERQSTINSAINQAKTSQRLFVNSGALQAGNTLDIRAAIGQRALNDALVNGPNSVARRQSNAGLYRLQFGERTVRSYETATELRRIDAERQSKIGQIQTDSTRNIIGSLTQNFDERIKNPELYRNAAQPGGAVPNIGTFDSKFIQSLNKGIADTVKAGNLDRFAAPSGAIDSDKMIKAIAGASGADKSGQEGIVRYLQAYSSIDIMKSVLDANKQILAVNEEAHTDSNRHLEELNGQLAQLDFKKLADYMGGIKNLMDRGSRRTSERNLIRGSWLMEHGRRPEERAFGASLYLGELKKQGIPLDPNQNTSLSKAIKKAYEIGIKNLVPVQAQSGQRVANSIARSSGSDNIFAQAAREIAQQASTKTTSAAFLSEFPMEDKKVASGAENDISNFTGIFNKELLISSNALADFANSINTSREKWERDTAASISAQKRLSEANKKDAETTNARYAQPASSPSSGQKEDSTGKKIALGFGPFIPLITQAIISGVITGFIARRGGAGGQGRSILESVRGAAGRVKSTTGALYEAASTKGIFGTSTNKEALDFYKAQKIVQERALIEKGRANRTVSYGARLTKPEIVPFPEIDTSVPSSWESMSRKQKRAIYSQRTREAQAAESKVKATYHELFEPKITSVSIARDRAYRGNQPINEDEAKILARNQEKAKLDTAEGRRARAKIEKITGRFKFGRGATIASLIALGLAIPSLAQAGQGGESSPAIGGGDIASLGIGTAINSLTMKHPNMTRLSSLRKGSLLALSDLAIGKVSDQIGGRTGEAVRNLGGVATGFGFFGLRGGIGAGIGVASEFARKNYTEKKFGYGAGLSQGFAGAVGAGAAFGGPVGSAISGGIYLAGETLAVRGETNDALREGRQQDSDSILKDASTLQGTTQENADMRGRRLLSQLFGREKTLKNEKLLDNEDFSGVYGKIMGTFSKKRFGQAESKELTQVTQQKERLGQAILSGDSAKILETLRDIQGELVKQSKDITSPDKKDGQSTSQINSAIKVDISVKDRDSIPSDINDNVVGPIAEQLANLQLMVNDLINQRSPQPAEVR